MGFARRSNTIAPMPRLHLSTRSVVAAGVAALLVVAIVAVALTTSPSDIAVASTTTTEPTTTTSLTTTSTSTKTAATTATVGPKGPLAPLTGLHLTDASLLDRRVVGVKVDNHPNARPQSALGQAEAVFEVVVEAGLTRFLALFHTTDSDYLGPMRSGRPTDGALMKPLGGTLAISGASHWVRRHLSQQGIDMVGEGVGTFRIPARSAPYNLYVDTVRLREVADDRGYPDEPPPVLWDFGMLPEDAAPADTVTMTFSDTVRATWIWIGNGYERSTNGIPHLLINREGDETPLTVDGVIVLWVDQYISRPPRPSDGVPVPASDTIGSGRAAVFAEGKVSQGSWRRESETDVFALVTPAGDPLEIPPGRYWVALVPNRGSVDWS